MVNHTTRLDTGAASVHWAELACLRAIEQAAREYRTAYQRDDIWGDEWTIECVEHRARLFALLDPAQNSA